MAKPQQADGHSFTSPVNKWTFRRAAWTLGLSVAGTLSVSLGSFFLYKHQTEKRLSDPRYALTTLIQTGPEKEALKTAYLAELLGLCVDRPVNVYAVDVEKAAQALLASPLIVKASVQRQTPGALYVDYEVRRPVAWLSDYRNIAIDRAGYLFPMTPFFSPQEMPEIYLGLPAFGVSEDSFGREGGKWKVALKTRYLDLAFEVLEMLEGSSWKEGLKVKRIDVSNAYAPTLGRREIVLFTEEELSLKQGVSFVFPKILRLAPKEYESQLQNFFCLRKTMLDDYRRQLAKNGLGGKFAPRIVDLRISQLAFVENTKSEGSP